MTDVERTTEQNSSIPSSNLDWKEKAALVIQSALQYHPLGGVISTAVFGTMAARQLKRVESTLKQYAEDLNRHGDKIDKSYFETDEFQGIFRRSVETFSREHQEVKLQVAKNLLVRNTVDGNPAFFDVDAYVLELVAGLTSNHLLCLLELSRPVEKGTSRGGPSGFHRPDEIALRLKINLSLVWGILGHLKSLGLAYGEAGMMMVGRATVSADVSYALTEVGGLVLSRICEEAPKPKGADAPMDKAAMKPPEKP